MYENYEIFDEEFPVKDRTRVIRRKKKIAKAMTRKKLREAKRPGVVEDYRQYFGDHTADKMDGLFFLSKKVAKGEYVDRWLSIWRKAERIAPVGARRRMEAMDQDEKAYHKNGLISIDEIADDILFYLGDRDYDVTAEDVAYAYDLAHELQGFDYNIDLLQEVA